MLAKEKAMQFIIGTIISLAAIITTVIIAVWQQRQSRTYPNLAPQNDLPLNTDLALTAPIFDLQLQNSGSTVATNICGTLIVASPSSDKIYKHYLFQGKTPLSKRELTVVRVKHTLINNNNFKINRYTLSPPPDLRLIARLTVLYEDDDNRPYISIFDFTDQHHWKQVKFFRNAGKKASAFQDIIRLSPSEAEQIRTGYLYRTDTLEAPDIKKFCGRTQEIAELKQWILTDQSRVIAILGIGGIGKTALTARVVEAVKNEFSYIFWRSLQNAPPLKSILAKCLLLLSDQHQIDMPKEEEDQLSLLLQLLREKRCLIVLDNVETVLQEGNRAGQYREGYEGYGRLIQLLGETQHLGCLLLTSREKPKEIIRLEGKSFPIHSLELLGVGVKEGQEILSDRGLLVPDEEQIAELIRLYSGNPLALRLVADPIQRLFGGNVAAFLEVKTSVFGDLYDLLEQQFHRLSDLERSILYWLAIEREAVSLENLSVSIIEEIRSRTLLAALDSLQHRSIIEISSIGGFSLQPVIMEYTIDKIIEQACEEIMAETINIIGSHTLMKAQTKDYIRDSQERLILAPLAKRLRSKVGQEIIEQKLGRILLAQRKIPAHVPSYTAGNILNLLIHLKSKLRGYDFSYLMICQAYLQGVALPEVNFTGANFVKCIFTSTFGAIFSIALSPNEEILAAGTDTGDIQFWETMSGTPLSTYHEHDDWVRCVTFSPDGRILASCSDDQTIRLWDTRTGQRIKILREHTDWIRSIVFHPAGKMLASGSNDRTVRIWDVSSGQCIKVLQQHDAGVLSVAFDHQGSLLATASQDQTIKLWDIDSGQCIKTLLGHTDNVLSVAFDHQGHLLATASQDQTIKLWNIDSGQCIKTLLGHTDSVLSVAFDQQGHVLATASQDQTIKLWDIDSGQCIKTLSGHTSGITVVAFSPDNQSIASGSEDRTVKIWNISNGQCVRTLEEHTSPVKSLQFSQQGNILISAGEDQTARFWDMGRAQCITTLQGYTNGLRSIAFTPDGNTLVSGSTDPLVNIWDVQRGRCVKSLVGHSSGVRSVAISSNGQIIATGSHDRTIRLWDLTTGQCLKALQGHTDWIWAVAFRSDNQTLATGSHDQTVKLWNVDSGQCIQTLQGHTAGVRALAMSKDSQLLASGGEDSTVRIWHIDSGKSVTTLQGHTGWVKAITFSPDGQFLVTGSEDRTIKLWSTQTWQCFKTLHGHNGWLMGVAFSADGQFLASGSTSQEVKIWESQTWQCLKTLHGHNSWVMAVAFHPEGNFLASGGNEGTIKFWNIQVGECLKTLKSGPYDGMKITSAQGLSLPQQTMLKTLGAIDEEENEPLS